MIFASVNQKRRYAHSLRWATFFGIVLRFDLNGFFFVYIYTNTNNKLLFL